MGVRHAAREKGCVLLAADWSKQLFDFAQMRAIRYPLSDGDVGDAAAQAIRDAIKPKIEALAKGGSPVFESIKGYPSDVDEADASTMKDVMADMAAFQGRIRAVRALPLSQRATAAKALADEACQPPTAASTALAVIRLLKDSADTADDWTWLTNFVARLPADIASLEEVRETNAFALANAGQPIEAIAKLEELMTLSGPTPERLGLLGGRYKRLAAKAAAPVERLVYLNKSIDAYERGMEIDLNQYYCSSNLPRLYLQRNRKGDRERRSPCRTSWWRPQVGKDVRVDLMLAEQGFVLSHADRVPSSSPAGRHQRRCGPRRRAFAPISEPRPMTRMRPAPAPQWNPSPPSTA